MPYIIQKDRDALAPKSNKKAKTPGELNFQLTTLLLEYLGSTPTYQTYNDIIGALECCKLEFYRRSTASYENKKILTNGDVFPL